MFTSIYLASPQDSFWSRTNIYKFQTKSRRDIRRAAELSKL